MTRGDGGVGAGDDGEREEALVGMQVAAGGERWLWCRCGWRRLAEVDALVRALTDGSRRGGRPEKAMLAWMRAM